MTPRCSLATDLGYTTRKGQSISARYPSAIRHHVPFLGRTLEILLSNCQITTPAQSGYGSFQSSYSKILRGKTQMLHYSSHTGEATPSQHTLNMHESHIQTWTSASPRIYQAELPKHSPYIQIYPAAPQSLINHRSALLSTSLPIVCRMIRHTNRPLPRWLHSPHC